jgi:hypothetical protein
MSWRYQAVWNEDTPGDEGSRWYSLCEVFFDDNGKLEGWTEEPSMKPIGGNQGELQETLSLMLKDALMWKAVKFSDLTVGMAFEKAEMADGSPAALNTIGNLVRVIGKASTLKK